jgi:hypothetical protein
MSGLGVYGSGLTGVYVIGLGVHWIGMWALRSPGLHVGWSMKGKDGEFSDVAKLRGVWEVGSRARVCPCLLCA